MLIWGKRVTCLSESKDRKYFQEQYCLDISSLKKGLSCVKTITSKDAKIIAYAEYDGEIRQMFVLDEGDEVVIHTSLNYGENGFFNSDGFAFFTLHSGGKEKEYVLDNSPYSFKEGDEDSDEDVLAEAFPNIEKLLKESNLNIEYNRSDVLLLREL